MQGNNNISVDTSAIDTCLANVRTAVKAIETAIDNYDNSADSLGDSSFKPTIEANLYKIKGMYKEPLELAVPPFIEKIQEIKQEYENRVAKIEENELSPNSGSNF